MPENRPPIPADLEREVLMEAGYMCAIPVCQREPVQIAHIVPWSKCPEHRFENLIALCPTCHSKYDRGVIDRKAMRRFKVQLRERNRVRLQPAEPPPDPVQLARERLRAWETESLERFCFLVRTELSPAESPTRYENGRWSASYCLVGDIPDLPMHAWKSALQQAQDHAFGRPLWPVLGDQRSTPHTYDDTLEAWLGQEPGLPASESEFWRMSPEGYLYQTAGYTEDNPSPNLYDPSGQPRKPDPGTTLCWHEHPFRVAQVLLHAKRLAEALYMPSGLVVGRFHWGLIMDRTLSTAQPGFNPCQDMGDKFSHSFEAASEIDVELDEINSRLVELVVEATQPLFTRFFFQVEAEDVQRILALARQS